MLSPSVIAIEAIVYLEKSDEEREKLKENDNQPIKNSSEPISLCHFPAFASHT